MMHFPIHIFNDGIAQLILLRKSNQAYISKYRFGKSIVAYFFDNLIEDDQYLEKKLFLF